MSNQNNSSSITLKFKDVDVKQISCEAVKMGKDLVPLLRYGPDKKTLYIQCPWIKMNQYGIPPGELLSNNQQNEFYTNEDARLSLKFPIDPSSCVNTNVDDPSETNLDEIVAFTSFLKELDAHFKSSSQFMKLSNIDPDDKEKYNTIYRKPTKSKKGNDKEKFYSMKTKLDTDGEKDKKIKTEFYELNRDTKDLVLLNTNKYITLQELEKVIRYNSEVLPIIQLVKIWTQANGNWGVTLKVKKARVRKHMYSEKGNAEFIDDDDCESPVKILTTKSDSEVHKTSQVSKKIAQVPDDDDSDDSSESDDDVESDEESVEATPQPQPQQKSDKKVQQKSDKKVFVVDSDGESDNSIDVKHKSKSNTKKITAKPPGKPSKAVN